uniref:N-alpha-acetyltransferase 60 n=1 Tax=Xenopsylla cheopis TaxID=163159 RepID=A0A6M2DDW7_XENCH
MAAISWYHTSSNDSNSTDSGVTTIRLSSLADVQLRFLCPGDLEEVRALCQDWFPIDYPQSWYEDITSSTRFYALAAVLDSEIVGLIVAEIKPYSKLNKEDKGILPSTMGRSAEVGYILSLGVSKQHRRNGIASLLLDSLVCHLTTAERHAVKAIFLHVLTTNAAAILFYEQRRFRLHSFLPYYYSIRGRCKDGFTYVSYINGGHQPWGLYDYIKHFCGMALNAGGLCPWIGSRMRGAIRWFLQRSSSRISFGH